MSSQPRNYVTGRPKIDHNVYILGAGFSRDAGLPLVNNFLERMADAVEWLYANGRDTEAEAVRSVFDFRLRAAGAAYRAEVNIDNIEDLFSLASASEGEGQARQITTAIAATLDYAEQTTRPPTCTLQVKQQSGPHDGWVQKDEKYPLYQIYAGIVSGSLCRSTQDTKNTIITLNYDTLLENALTQLDIPFHYGLPAESTNYHPSANCRQDEKRDSIGVYKLHGSVNWGKPVTRTDNASVFGNYSDLFRHEREVLLIPPTWRKVFAEHLVRVWEHAVEALNNATRIIVIGFSMPRTDTHFKYLIAAGLQRNISLRKFLFVNPGLKESQQERTELTKNLFNILRRELARRGVVELVPSTVGDFLFHKASLKQIQRELREEYLGVDYLMSDYNTRYITEHSL